MTAYDMRSEVADALEEKRVREHAAARAETERQLALDARLQELLAKVRAGGRLTPCDRIALQVRMRKANQVGT